MLSLTADELLTTTRGVRRRLDIGRVVPDELIRECVTCALHAPAGSNVPRTRFVVVRSPELKQRLAAVYGEIYEGSYKASSAYIGRVAADSRTAQAAQDSAARSADALPAQLANVPAIVIACLVGARIDHTSAMFSATFLGGVLPAMWSFMVAARARGLGTCWTTMHLAREREVADLLSIPYDTVQQVCLSPLAFTRGTDFKPALRPDPEDVIHWDTWDESKPLPPAVGEILGPRQAAASNSA
jgi:nitroreductase